MNHSKFDDGGYQKRRLENKIVDAVRCGAHTAEEIQDALSDFKKEEIKQSLFDMVGQKKLWIYEYCNPPGISYYITKI